MKIRSGFILRNIADDWIVVAIGPNSRTFNKMVKLNPTSKFIWDRLAEGIEDEQLVQALTDEYDVSEVKARKDIKKLIDQLTELGCIEI